MRSKDKDCNTTEPGFERLDFLPQGIAGCNTFAIPNCMNTRIYLLMVFLTISIISFRCIHHEIILDNVSDLPENFIETYHFGKDLTSINDSKKFVLITGRIDTTTDSPPLHLAIVSVAHHKFFLKLLKTNSKDDAMTEKYAGNGYSLDLTYREKHIQDHSPIYEGYFIIRHTNNRSQYEVVGSSVY